MKKKIFIILSALILVFVFGVMYLNAVILPTKIRSLVVQGLQDATQKKVALDSLRFNIFKGLVLKNLVLYDDQEKFLTLKEGSCNIFILPLFFKKIVIPAVRLESLTVFLERRSDYSLNIMDLFGPARAKQDFTQNKKFSLAIYKIAITNSRLNFKDRTLPSEFSKAADSLNLILRLSLPAGVKFNLNCNIAGKPGSKVIAAGEYKLAQRELKARVSIKDLSVGEFAGYYQNLGISFTQGLIDTVFDLKFKEDIAYLDLEAKSRDLIFRQNKVQAQINSDLGVSLQYSLKDRQLKFSGSADIAKLDLLGLEFPDKVNDIKGKVNFDNAGFSADKLTAGILGIPLEVKLRFTDYKNPFLDIEATSAQISLSSIETILKDRFKVILPADLQGEGRLFFKLGSMLPFTEPLPINGYLDLFDATLKIEKLKSPFTNISGRLDFDVDQLKWPKLNFQYSGVNYQTEGSLNNFKAPQVQLKLFSSELFLESQFAVAGELIQFSKLDGRYLNSNFSVKGNMDIKDPPSLPADIIARVNLDLNDLKGTLKNFKDKLGEVKPSGIVDAKINLSGNINDIKNCFIQASLSSSSLSLYGLKSENFSLDYRQENGLMDVPLIHFSCYDGAIDLSAKMNLFSENLPYWVSVNIRDVKLEKLKLDTVAKAKDISGTLQGEAKINGFNKDLARITGTGRLSISEGKLWELNLFQGLGKLLFAKDSSSITIQEGSCDFFIQDKSVFTNNLKMNGEFIDLSGNMQIGFDSSLDASLNVKVDDAMIPLSGTFKDITTAILGQTGRFGIIKISGTLKEPKYKFQTVALDILKALKNTLFGK